MKSVLEGYVLDLLAKGRLTISPAAELFKPSVYDTYHLARECGIEIGWR